MSKSWRWILVIAIVGLPLLSCAQPETETESPSADVAPVGEEPGPDPTVVDADHYKVEFENDQVRVLRITYGPGEESVMHHHPDSVAVFLTPHHVEFRKPDGTSVTSTMDPGQHLFTPAEQHLPKNVGAEPLELVLVELKAAPEAPGETGPDPVEVDAKHYKVEFENERVRLLRIAYGPSEGSVMHYHPDSVAVFLTDHHGRFGKPDGSSEEAHFEAGQHVFSAAEQHLPKNIGTERFELVLVELR